MFTMPEWLGSGDHASRPAAGDVAHGALYACSDHDLIYQSDGSSWSTWSDVGGSGTVLGTWTSFTPTMTATTTNPTLGSSTLTGRYKALDSKTYIIIIELTITTGGAWNAGSGTWEWALPGGVTTPAGYTQSLGGYVLDNGTDNKVATGTISASGSKVGQVIFDGGNVLTHGGPGTAWATGDVVHLQGIIEVA